MAETEVDFFATFHDGYEGDPINPAELEALVDRIVKSGETRLITLIETLQAEESNGMFIYDPQLLEWWTQEYYYFDPLSTFKEMIESIQSIPMKVAFLFSENERAERRIASLKLAVEGIEELKDEKASLYYRLDLEKDARDKKKGEAEEVEESAYKKSRREEFDLNLMKLYETKIALEEIHEMKELELDGEETAYSARKCIAYKLHEWLKRKEGTMATLAFDEILPSLKQLGNMLTSFR